MTADRAALSVHVARVVVHAGSDRVAAQRLARRLPDSLRAELDAGGVHNVRDVTRLVRQAASEARR